MDFNLAMTISGLVSAGILVAALATLIGRLRSVYEQVTVSTRRTLILFGFATLCLGMIVLSFEFIPNMLRLWWVLFFVFMIMSQIHILTKSTAAIRGAAVFVTAFSIPIMGSVVLEPSFEAVMLPAGVVVFGVLAVALAFRLARISQTPFTGSILVVTLLSVFTIVLIQLGVLVAEPRYFIILSLPLVVSSSILFSMLKPWRWIIIGSLGLFVISTAIPIAIAAIMAGDFFIWSYVLVASIAGACAIAPLNFFMTEAINTRARTPAYLSLVLIGLTLLAVSHANAWAIAQQFGSWDRNILFIDWIIGVFVVAAFVQSGASAVMSDRGRLITRESLIMVSAAFVMLGNRNLYVLETELDILYVPLGVFIAIGVVLFAVVSARVRRAGNTPAALRFFFFVVAALFIGLIAMFSDIFFDIGLYSVMLGMLVISGLMLLASSPLTVGFLRRTS